MSKKSFIAAAVVAGVLILVYVVCLWVFAWLWANDTRGFEQWVLLWLILGSLGVWIASLALLGFAIGALCKRFVWVAVVSLIIAGLGAWAPLKSGLLVRHTIEQTRFKLLERAGFENLRHDAEIIFRKSPNCYQIAEDDWPESIRRLKPLGVRTNSRGVEIYFMKFVSKESGVFVLPPKSTYEPKSDGSVVRYRKIADGLYWYGISG